MEIGYVYLLIAEVVVILSVVGIKLIFNYIEHKKINKVLRFIDKKSKNVSDKEVQKRIEECIEIIRQNSNNCTL